MRAKTVELAKSGCHFGAPNTLGCNNSNSVGDVQVSDPPRCKQGTSVEEQMAPLVAASTSLPDGASFPLTDGPRILDQANLRHSST